MSRLLVVLGIALLLQSAIVGFSSGTVQGIVDWSSETGQLVAGEMRVVGGVALFIAAANSRFPRGLKVYGVLVFAAVLRGRG